MSLSQKRLLALVGLGVVGAIAIVPYQLALLPADAPAPPLPLLIVGGIVQSAILVAIAAAIGGLAAPRAGLAMPVLDAALTGQQFGQRIRGFAAIAVALGVAASVVVVLIDYFVFTPLLHELLPAGASLPQAPAWTGALAALYGAFIEEILLRYFLMSVAAWLLLRVLPARIAFPVAIVFTAVLFGLGHLPATSTFLPLTPIVLTRAILLNGLAGLAFGWLYWRRGLEAAMLSHFSADIVLQSIVPALAAMLGITH